MTTTTTTTTTTTIQSRIKTPMNRTRFWCPRWGRKNRRDIVVFTSAIVGPNETTLSRKTDDADDDDDMKRSETTTKIAAISQPTEAEEPRKRTTRRDDSSDYDSDDEGVSYEGGFSCDISGEYEDKLTRKQTHVLDNCRTTLDFKTKIICTLGPSSRTVEQLENLLQLECQWQDLTSHGSHEYHRETLDNLRSDREYRITVRGAFGYKRTGNTYGYVRKRRTGAVTPRRGVNFDHRLRSAREREEDCGVLSRLGEGRETRE